MRFCSLGSGSKGNATLIECSGTYILVDCGFSAKEFALRMDSIGVSPESLTAILVTHEHGDHIKGVGAVSRRWKVPVWMTHGTRIKSKCGDIASLNLFHADNGSFSINHIKVQPVAVPHDAREPCQYVFESDASRLGILTDLGCITPHIIHHYKELNALLLECNHDLDMLRKGPYPQSLQTRVRSNHGHLNNQQSVELLQQVTTDHLQSIVFAHISGQNNHPDLVMDTLVSGCGEGLPFKGVLKQDCASEWFDVV